MRIVSFLALLGLAFTLAGCGGDDEKSSAPVPERPPEAIQVDEARFLGFLWPSSGVGEIQVARLDPLTLAPTSKPLTLDASGGVTELSPDGNVLALAAGEAAEIEFLDLKNLRSLGSFDLDVPGYISRLSWPEPGWLFAAVGQSAVARVYPGARQLIDTQQVGGVMVGDAEEIPAGMLALVGPSEGIGPLKAVVFGGKGTIPAHLRIVGGFRAEEGVDEADYRGTENIPGLAVDPSGRRALVVPAGGDVAEISLNNLRVRYHSLSQRVSWFERLGNWLEPKAEAKLIEGPIRQAIWMSSGLVAVTGVDQTVSAEKDVITDPAGLSLIDTSDWSVRIINEQVNWARLAGERLLGFEPACGDDQESFGFTAYDLEGAELFRICRAEGFDPQVVGDYVYLGFDNNTRFEVLDLRTGKTVARPTTAKTTSLITD